MGELQESLQRMIRSVPMETLNGLMRGDRRALAVALDAWCSQCADEEQVDYRLNALVETSLARYRAMSEAPEAPVVEGDSSELWSLKARGAPINGVRVSQSCLVAEYDYAALVAWGEENKVDLKFLEARLPNRTPV